MRSIEFSNRVLILGYGAVCRCTLPILLDHVKIPLRNITLIDFEDKAKELEPFTKKGLRYFQRRITPENLDSILDRTSVG